MRITDDLILLWFVEKEEKDAGREGLSISDIISTIENSSEKIKELIKTNLVEIGMLATIYFREPVIISSVAKEAEVVFSYYKKYFLEKREKITV